MCVLLNNKYRRLIYKLYYFSYKDTNFYSIFFIVSIHPYICRFAVKIRYEEATLKVDHNSYIIKQFLGFEDGLVSSRLENLVKVWLKNMYKRTDIDIAC